MCIEKPVEIPVIEKIQKAPAMAKSKKEKQEEETKTLDELLSEQLSYDYEESYQYWNEYPEEILDDEYYYDEDDMYEYMKGYGSVDDPKYCRSIKCGYNTKSKKGGRAKKLPY